MKPERKTIHFPDSHGNIVEMIQALIKEGVISLPEKDLTALTEYLTTLNLESMLEGLSTALRVKDNPKSNLSLYDIKKLLMQGTISPLPTVDNSAANSDNPTSNEETKSDDRPQPSKNEDQQSYIHKLNGQLDEAIRIIKSIKLPVEDPETIYTLHSIGDNLADRAGVSILMLELISHLNNGLGLKMLINFSNHDSEELKALKKNFDKKRDIWPSLVLDTTQGASYSASQLLIALGIYGKEVYTKLLLNYQALVKLFVFEMMPKSVANRRNNGETKNDESNEEETELIIYTHAPSDITAIEQLAQLWLPKALQELKRNPRTLATALMAMNDKFSQVLDEYFQPIDNDILDAVLFRAVHSRLRTKPLWSNDEAGYKSILGKVHKETGTREITEEKKQVLCIKARTLLEAIIWNRRCSFEGLRNMPEFATSAFGHTGPCGVQILELKEANEKALNGIRSLERTVTNIKKIACLFILNCIECTPPNGRAKAISDFLLKFVNNDHDFEFEFAREYVEKLNDYDIDDINIYKLLDGFKGKPGPEEALKRYKAAIAKVDRENGIPSAIDEYITITTDEDSYRYIAGPLKNEILIKLAELVKSTSLQQEDKLNQFQAFVAKSEFPSMVHTTDSKMTEDYLKSMSQDYKELMRKHHLPLELKKLQKKLVETEKLTKKLRDKAPQWSSLEKLLDDSKTDLTEYYTNQLLVDLLTINKKKLERMILAIDAEIADKETEETKNTTTPSGFSFFRTEAALLGNREVAYDTTMSEVGLASEKSKQKVKTNGVIKKIADKLKRKNCLIESALSLLGLKIQSADANGITFEKSKKNYLSRSDEPDTYTVMYDYFLMPFEAIKATTTNCCS